MVKHLTLRILAVFGSSVVTVPASSAVPVKACIIYPGPIGDFGWSYQHHEGMLEMKAALGDKVEIVYQENVPEGADAERTLERLARSGCDIIFGASFSFMDPLNRVAGRFPNVKFESSTGYKRDHPNVSTYNSRFYEGRYIQGVIAAKVSKVGIAGYIGAYPIPEGIMGMNAFMLGAQSVDPDFKLKIVWANTWFDPGKEADAAKVLIDQGADVIAQHTDSTAPVQIAEERGIKAFGQASDMTNFGLHAHLTSTVDNWGPYYIRRVQAVLEQGWHQQDTWGGINDGHVVMAPYANMAEDVKRLAQETEARIKAGFNPFTGPIVRQDGSRWLGKGEVAQDSALLGMNFFVKGIDDKLPQ